MPPARASLLLVLALLVGLALPRPAAADAPPSMRAAPPAEAVARSAEIDAPTDLALPVRLQRGRVIVRAEARLGERARAVAERADATLAAIAADLGELPVPATVEIRLVDDTEDMQRAAPAGARIPDWAAGVAFPRLGIVIVAERRGGQPLDPDGTVDHELAHLALGAALGDAAPRWLHEGFAYLHSPDFSGERWQTLAGMAWFGSTIPLPDLELRFPAQELPASRAYAQSYDFVSFLARRGRWPEATDDGDRYPFRRFLAQVAHTGDVDAAAYAAYGRRLPELFDEWRGDLKNRFLFLPIGLGLLLLWLAAIVLLVLGWRRRRRQGRARLAEWEAQERAAREAAAAQPPTRLVPAVPVWSGPSWAPPGAPVAEPPEDDLDVVLDDDDDDAPRPPPPPRRRPPTAPN